MTDTEKYERLLDCVKTIRNTFAVGTHVQNIVPFWAHEVTVCCERALADVEE